MKFLKFIGLGVLFAVPVSILSQWLDFDKASAIIFAIVVAILLYFNREKIDMQKIAFPILYLILIRTKVGLNLMNKLASKYREFIKLLGYSFIGLGFFGMIYISISFFKLIFMLIKDPIETSQGVALILPFTNVPGVGYLSFWYFIIGIFFIAVIHEFAHGVMARAHKLNVQSSGVGFFGLILPIIPIAFVEPNEKSLRKQKDVVQYSIFSAGPAINLIVALIIVLILPFVVNPFAYAPFEEQITEPLGVSFPQIEETLPAYASGLEPGVIINKIDDQPVKDYKEFLGVMQSSEPNKLLTFYSNEKEYSVTPIEHPEGNAWGYIGVSVQNERDIKEEHKNLKAPYYWLKGLFRWLFILNFLIGMINLLPILITDGGRMLELALRKMFKDKVKAAKLFMFISTLFLLTIGVSLLLNYGTKLFGIF